MNLGGAVENVFREVRSLSIDLLNVSGDVFKVSTEVPKMPGDVFNRFLRGGCMSVNKTIPHSYLYNVQVSHIARGGGEK